MRTYRRDEDDKEVVDAIDTAFGLERDLQMALRHNIDELEPGLTITDGGREQTVDSGRIDITCTDEQGGTVVIELKAGTADRDAMGQILSYIGDHGGNTRVRGILVAHDFTDRAIAATRAATTVRLVRYGFRFTFDPVALARER